MSRLESNAVRPRMNGVSLDANASRDTPILRQCVITETLVYDFIVKFTTLLSVYNYCSLTIKL